MTKDMIIDLEKGVVTKFVTKPITRYMVSRIITVVTRYVSRIHTIVTSITTRYWLNSSIVTTLTVPTNFELGVSTRITTQFGGIKIVTQLTDRYPKKEIESRAAVSGSSTGGRAKEVMISYV